MKNAGTPQRSAHEAERADGRTRQAVAKQLLEQGPMTAMSIAEELGLSPAAVRRHLDALLADKEVSTREASRRQPRGRGRPAKLFLLTESGRAQFGHAYDDLAVAALRYLAEFGGEDAVRAFAQRRIATLVDRHREVVLSISDPVRRAEALAQALSSEGYAASTRRVGHGEQLCQHHCPVAHVAAEFPQLCEAETTAFAELLGSHVQRLATIARGDAVCTTHLPLIPVAVSQNDPVPPTAGTTTTRPEPAEKPVPGQTARIPDGGEPA